VSDRDRVFKFYMPTTFNFYMLFSNTYIFHPISKLTSNYIKPSSFLTNSMIVEDLTVIEKCRTAIKAFFFCL